MTQQPELLFHYTNEKGYKAIGSQQTWLFKASTPPGNHPKGAYFTNLPPGTKNLGKKLFVRGCADKIDYVFSFTDGHDLKPLTGGGGAFIFYSTDDYPVPKDRQRLHGPSDKVAE